LLLIALPFIASAQLGHIKNEEAKLIIKTLLPYFNSAYFISLALLFIINIINFSKEKRVLILGFSMVFIFNYIGWLYAHVREIPVKNAAIYVKQHNIKHIVMYHLNTPSFNVYAKMLVEKRYPKSGDIVLTTKRSLKKFKNYKVLFHEGIVYLIKIPS
jgi:hypothetical protein